MLAEGEMRIAPAPARGIPAIGPVQPVARALERERDALGAGLGRRRRDVVAPMLLDGERVLQEGRPGLEEIG